MTRDDVIRMAREAGATIRRGHRQGIIVYEDGGNLSPMVIYRFAELVAADEREACAKVCEAVAEKRWPDDFGPEAEDCAASIREMGEKGGTA